MAAEETYQKIIEYLKKESPLNTFRLARELQIERPKLLNFIKKLESQGAVEVIHGSVKFLKFPVEEKIKEAVESKTISKLKKKVAKKSKKIKKKPAVLKTFQAENQKLKEKIIELEENIKKLEKIATAAPKTIIKTIIKKVPVIKTITQKPPVPSPKKRKRKRRAKPKRKVEGKIKIKKAEKKTKKFKFPKFKFIKGFRFIKRKLKGLKPKSKRR